MTKITSNFNITNDEIGDIIEGSQYIERVGVLIFYWDHELPVLATSILMRTVATTSEAGWTLSALPIFRRDGTVDRTGRQKSLGILV
jgi:hypothetical protein